MGYRSDVACAIYGDPLTLDALWSTRPEKIRSEFDKHVTEFEKDDAKGVFLSGEQWKWYEGYPDVDAWHAFMDEALRRDLNVEFVRVGEEADDVVRDAFGPAVQYILGTRTVITTDL
jgi:hypothetical protein